MQPAPGGCPECGFLHPPLKFGEKCPLAKPKDKEGKVIETAEFLSQIKNITTYHIQTKSIKDTKTLFSKIILELTKFLENYHG